VRSTFKFIPGPIQLGYLEVRINLGFICQSMNPSNASELEDTGLGISKEANLPGIVLRVPRKDHSILRYWIMFFDFQTIKYGQKPSG